jgi:ferredoxin-NADP reductase/DMSO/TMAO reductase YedYZ heme-binding membrane subunit
MSDLDFSRWLVVINCGVPLALLAWDAFRGTLGADPVKISLHTTGLLSLIFLCLSLLVTPVRDFSGLPWLVLFRRSLGLYAFFYAAAHFAIFFIWDRSLSVPSTIHEIFTRTYLIIGTIGLVLMMPLAVTSTNGMVRRLGAKRWRLLHQLAYLAIIAGVIHFYLQAKSDKRLPEAFAVATGVLLAYRLVRHYAEAWEDGAVTHSRGFSVKPRPKVEAAVTPAAPIKPRFWTGQLRIARTFDETPSVRTFRLLPVDGSDLPFDYLPGQYLNLALTIDGKKVNRSYTIASSPSRRGYCELTIKREQAGVASRHLHGMLHEGDVLNVSAPAGRFTFTGKEADSLVLIGGGVGITPLMSVVRYLTDHCWPGDIFLVYAVKTRQDIIFEQELTTLAKRFPNLHLTLTLSREPSQDWTGERGRITPELLTRAIPNLANRLVHLCGPSEMMEPVKQMLLSLGVAEGRIKSEAFTPAGQMTKETVPDSAADDPDVETAEAGATPADPSPIINGNFMVNFAKSNRTVPVDPLTTILEAAEAVGVNIDYNCRSGICGTCKIKLLAGQVEMETRDALSASDDANGVILACQGKPLGDVTVSA